MRRFAFAILLLAAPAFAQEAPQTVDQVREDANGIIAAVRQQRDAANDALAQAMAQIAKLTRQIEASKRTPPPEPEQKDMKK